MKVLFAVLLSLNIYCVNSYVNETVRLWKKFQTDFNKTYHSRNESDEKFEKFSQNFKTIRQHNEGNSKFKMGINQFSDMTFEELLDLNKVNVSIDLSFNDVPYNPLNFRSNENFLIPSSFDWRDLGAVTGVKDQKLCGSCYAFASLAAIESQVFIRKGIELNLSVQEIVDCGGNDYFISDCQGGMKHMVYQYVKDFSISSADDYPYNAVKGECRKDNFSRLKFHVEGFGEVQSYNEHLIMEALVTVGPLTISLDIDHESFLRYSHGIYSDPDCTSNTNHAALLVGYGSENGEDFWIIKNSFGVSWGESGYIRITRNNDFDCGVTSYVLFPIMK